MAATVQARLDDQTRAALDRLVRRLGWSPSEVVREGIRLMNEKHKPVARRKLIGVGRVASGIPDLGTNEKYMEDFGQKSMGRSAKAPAKGRKR